VKVTRDSFYLRKSACIRLRKAYGATGSAATLFGSRSFRSIRRRAEIFHPTTLQPAPLMHCSPFAICYLLFAIRAQRAPHEHAT
jgi:hypothetical protein